MSKLVLTVTFLAILSVGSFAVTCSNTAGCTSMQCVGTLTQSTSSTASSGTCAGSATTGCAHTSTTVSTICTDNTNVGSASAQIYCNSGVCSATPITCTGQSTCTSNTDTLATQCVYISSTIPKGCGRACTQGTATGAYGKCVDSTTPYCSSSFACTSQSCTNSAACVTAGDTTVAQCVTTGTSSYTCQASCNHNTGSYCYDTQTSSPKLYCVSNACQTAPATGSLVASASIPANCAVGTSTTVCTACKQGYGLSTSGTSTTCVACNAACLDCVQGGVNTSCVAYKYPLDGVYRTDTTIALANCSSGYVAGAVTSGIYTCYNCSTNCTNCQNPNTANVPTANSPTICQACSSGSYLNGSQIVVNSTTSANQTVGYNCVGCPANCTSCTNSTYCIKCNGTLTWNNSTKKCFGSKITVAIGSIFAVAFTAFVL